MDEVTGNDSTARRPTLTSVAEAAGVSRQTVSNVLNAPHRVRPETLAQVREVLTSVGYRPNLAARQLRTGRSKILGMRMRPTTDGINGAILDGFLHALTERAQSEGYRLVLFTATDDDDEIRQYQELLDTTAIDGFVLTDTHHGDTRTQWLESVGTPFVTFGRPWARSTDPDASHHSWVDVDGAAGTHAAVEHLIARGHRRIGFVGWPPGSGTGDERRAGWRRAMRTLGVEDRDLDALDVAVADAIAEGGRATNELIARSDITAVVCASDSLGLGALGATRRLGRPRAVVGYDDTPVAAAVGLSSVAQPLADVAGATVRSLVRQMSAPEGTPEHELLGPTLVVRGSSESAEQDALGDAVVPH